VNIKFISTLTPEDENAMAPAVLKAVASILDLLPIAYMIRIDTSDAHVYSQHSQPTGKPMLPTEAHGQSTMPMISFDS
jgi:hypothetical protein